MNTPKDMNRLRLSREGAVLLVIDIQERLLAVMAEPGRARLTREAVRLLGGAAVLGVPVLVTEQYPKGLGPTVAPVLAALPAGTVPLTKMEFSSAAVLAPLLASGGPRQMILCGMESHVCVFQTARDLLEAGHQVYVPRDAVLSRAAENLEAGLSLMAQAGAVIGCVESALFDLCGRSGTAEFKAISALVK